MNCISETALVCCYCLMIVAALNLFRARGIVSVVCSGVPQKGINIHMRPYKRGVNRQGSKLQTVQLHLRLNYTYLRLEKRK